MFPPNLLLAVHDHRRRMAALLGVLDDACSRAESAGSELPADDRGDVTVLLGRCRQSLRASDGRLQRLVNDLDPKGRTLWQ